MSSSRAVALACALAFGAAHVSAQAPPPATPRRSLEPPPVEIPSPITDHFSIRGSFLDGKVSTDARFDSTNGAAGTPFSAENDFGLNDKSTQGRIEVIVRMRERSRLRVDYFKLDRAGGVVLARPIRFRNTVYAPGDLVQSELNLRLMGFTYAYSLLQRETFELGLGLGVHLVQADTRAAVRARSVRDSGSADGGLPTLALDGTWRFAERWSVNARAQYLKVNVSGVDGNFSDAHFDVQYRWKPNVALGLGYSTIRLDASLNSSDLPGALAISTRGPEAFLRVSF
jgi:hypothetical protein